MQTNTVLFLKTFNADVPFYERITGDTLGPARLASVALRSLSLSKDLPLLHEWVNHPYSERFWQLKGYTPEMLYTLYSDLLLKPYYHSLIGLYDDKPVCQADVYLIQGSELSAFIPDAKPADCGIHFLMAPPREIFKGLSLLMLRSFIEFYFANPFSGDLYVEPDELNALANLLAKKAGFQLYRKVNLPDKIANVYKITKQEFLSQTPVMPSY